MLYKNNQIWRDNVGIGGRVQFVPKKFRQLKGDRPKIPYKLIIETNTYWGNFEREFIAYSMGILDDVQMESEHGQHERKLFWEYICKLQGLENTEIPPTFDYCLENYPLLKDYIFETFQEVNDGWQTTFYNFDVSTENNDKTDILKIQLAQPLTNEYENIIIPRMIEFFKQRVYPYCDADLKSIVLVDNKDRVVKKYIDYKEEYND